MVFLFVLALLILGPRKLPELGRSIGKGMAEFRRASNELRSTFEREMSAIEQEKQSFRGEVAQLTSTTDYTYPSSGSDYTYDDYSYSYDSTSSESAPQAAESNPAPASTDPGEIPTQTETTEGEVKS
jgi:TatA/E family protein of Tat protein translocase